MRSGLDRVSRVIRIVEFTYHKLGVPVDKYLALLRALEVAGVDHLIGVKVTYVRNCREVGTSAMAERKGVSPRAVCKARTVALAEIAKIGTDTHA